MAIKKTIFSYFVLFIFVVQLLGTTQLLIASLAPEKGEHSNIQSLEQNMSDISSLQLLDTQTSPSQVKKSSNSFQKSSLPQQPVSPFRDDRDKAIIASNSNQIPRFAIATSSVI